MLHIYAEIWNAIFSEFKLYLGSKQFCKSGLDYLCMSPLAKFAHTCLTTTPFVKV